MKAKHKKIILLMTMLSLVGCGTTEVSSWPVSNHTELPYSEADNIRVDLEIKKMYQSHGLVDPNDWTN